MKLQFPKIHTDSSNKVFVSFYIKNKRYRFSFCNHVIIIIVFLISLFGVLNLLKHIIIESYPFTEIYINYFYDFFNIVKENISNLLN